MENNKITFKDIQNFFGDRGIILAEGDFIKWGINDKYVYWIPNNKYCDDYLEAELGEGKSVLWVSRDNIHLEIEDEVWLKDAPFELIWSN